MPAARCLAAGSSGVTLRFRRLSPGGGRVLHVLLSRSPLASTRRWVPFDLHVLGAPPAFILSQDRTLRPMPPWKGLSGASPHPAGMTPIGSISSMREVFPVSGSDGSDFVLPHYLRCTLILRPSPGWPRLRLGRPRRPARGIRFSRCPPRVLARAAGRYSATPRGLRGRELALTHFLHK